MPKLSIITPTLLRDSLIRTCESINNQSYTNWEHIVMIDTKEVRPDIMAVIKHPNRRIYRCSVPHKNFGNTCRWNGWAKARGDYIGYIDDDDYFVNGAFQRIVNSIEGTRPPLIVFPAQRYGEKFFNLPPAICMTVTGQYMHTPYIHGKEARWPKVTVGDQGYLYDGKFVEKLKSMTNFTPISEDISLIVIEESNHGEV